MGLFRVGPVVGEKEDDGVVELVQFLQLVEQAAEVSVQVLDHGGVDLHFPGGFSSFNFC